MPEWLCAAERLLQASMTGETALMAEMGEAANKTTGQEVRRQHSVWRRRAAMAAAKGRARRAAALLQQTWRQHAAKLAQAAYDEREAKDRVEKFFAKAIAEEAWQRAMAEIDENMAATKGAAETAAAEEAARAQRRAEAKARLEVREEEERANAGLELLDGLVRRPEHDQPQHVVSLPRSRPVDIAGALEAGLGELAQRLARLDAHLQHRSKWNESGHKGRQGAMNAARMQHLLRQHTT